MNNNPVCFGSGLISLDILIKGNDIRNLSYYVGGSCGNVMMILSHMGWDSYPIARLSNNKHSSRLVSDLIENGIKIDFITQTKDGSTPIIIQRNLMDKDGNPKHKFELVDPKTGQFFPRFKSITKNIAKELIEQSSIIPNVFYFDRVTPGILSLVEYYKSKGTLIVFEPSSMGGDAQFNKAIKFVDILKFSDQRISSYEDIYKKTSIPLEIKTMGMNGLIYRCNFIDSKWYHLNPFSINHLVDSSGAGDWTTAGIIYYLNKKYHGHLSNLAINDIEDVLNFAQKLGALNCTFEGARGLMTLAQESIMESINQIK